MPRRVKNSPPLKIKDVAEQIEKHISVLENLVADNNTSPIVDDAIKRRCFVREIANLGEALKGFRYNNSPRHNNNPLLELQSIEVSNTFKKLPKNEGEAVDNSLIN